MLYTWPFFALMPVVVVVGVALHSLLKETSGMYVITVPQARQFGVLLSWLMCGFVNSWRL
ncbi:DUF3561 family protein [Shigella flexneri]